MLNRSFLYTPKSGDKLIAVNDIEGIVMVRYSNFSYTFVGNFVKLEVFAAERGRNYFRKDARRFAKEVIEGIGGYAYDNCGNVGLIIPFDYGLRVRDIMAECLGFDGASLDAQLWRQGLLTIVSINWKDPLYAVNPNVHFTRLAIERSTFHCRPVCIRITDGDSSQYVMDDYSLKVTEGCREMTFIPETVQTE